jgi:hypothetical protein
MIAEDRTYLEVMNIIAELTVNGEQIDFEPVNHYELYVLARGGVEVRDFEEAVNAWLATKRHTYGTHWGYIRSIALRKAAERELIKGEVL